MFGTFAVGSMLLVTDVAVISVTADFWTSKKRAGNEGGHIVHISGFGLG